MPVMRKKSSTVNGRSVNEDFRFGIWTQKFDSGVVPEKQGFRKRPPATIHARQVDPGGGCNNVAEGMTT